jgi:cytochrome c oxidase subunit III
MNTITDNSKETTYAVHPQKFAMWIGIVGMIMMFAALTSAYLVRKSGGNWLDFALPQAFFYSTVLILLSSVTMHLACQAFRENNDLKYKVLVTVTAFLGVAFVVTQYQGKLELDKIGVYLHTNPSSSFLFLLTGLHVLHVLVGITVLLTTWLFAFLKPISKFALGLQHLGTDEMLDNIVRLKQKRLLRLEIVATFWHFLDVLWVYLFVFFLMQQ